MESSLEATLPVEDHDIEDVEKEPTHEDYVLVAKATATVFVVGALAVYGASVAIHQVVYASYKKIQEHKAKKKENSPE